MHKTAQGLTSLRGGVAFEREDSKQHFNALDVLETFMLNRRSFLTTAAIAAPTVLLMSRPAMATTPRTFSENGLAIRGAE